MNPSTALRTGVRLLWARSASVLPVYLLASGLYGVARTPLVVAVGAAVWLLAASGRLDPFLDILRDASAGTGSVDPGAVAPERLGDALLGLLTPSVLILLVAGVLVSTALALLASAAGSAAAISGLFGLIRDDDGVESAITGARRYWQSFLGSGSSSWPRSQRFSFHSSASSPRSSGSRYRSALPEAGRSVPRRW